MASIPGHFVAYNSENGLNYRDDLIVNGTLLSSEVREAAQWSSVAHVRKPRRVVNSQPVLLKNPRLQQHTKRHRAASNSFRPFDMVRVCWKYYLLLSDIFWLIFGKKFWFEIEIDVVLSSNRTGR